MVAVRLRCSEREKISQFGLRGRSRVPDLTTIYVQVCAQDSVAETVPSSSGKGTYDVFVSRDEQFRDTCTCPGFGFRGKCKHLTAVREKLCDWNAHVSDETQTPQQEMEAVCPKCGGETRVIRMGV
jgi:hypothetical protein